MKPILTRLFTGILLLFAAQVFGQAPNMTTAFVVTQPATPSPYAIGTKVVVELRVTNFTNIESMQFPITYNKDAMRFDSLTEAVFSNWNPGNFVSVPLQGKIGISWDGYSNGASMPFSFPNGTAIFKLNFTVIGNGTGSININPASAPPALDIVGNGQPGQINYQSGGTPNLILGSGNPPPPPLVGFKIVANTIYIPQGERGCMPVTVNDFDNIVSMQWAMHWNNSVLNYECVRNFNLSGWSTTDFNSTYAAGTLLAGWADPSGVGVTKADGVRIVDVCFKAIGAPGTSATVTIDGVGFPPGNGSAEAYNSSSVNVWTTGGANGASGVSAPINVMITAPTDVTYSVDTVLAAQNTQGCVPVKVKNFTNVTSAEFALTYNTTELTYVNTQFATNPLNLASPANVSNSTNGGTGIVKFSWSNVNGATVPADGVIFTPCFTVLAPSGTKANITFTTTPCPTVIGMGTTVNGVGGVSMVRNNGWIKSGTNGPNLTATPAKCNGSNDGSIALDNPPASVATSYAWAGPGGYTSANEDPAGLAPGTYTVTVTYSGGTTATASTTVTQPQVISETHTINTLSCFGGSNGAINLTVSGGNAGGYTFMWSNNSTVEDPSNLAAGSYTVTIKDTKNCSFTSQPITVTGPSQINLPNGNVIVSNVTCAGLTNGSIVINPTGGAGGYTYDWSHNGAQTPDTDPKDLSNMAAGTYTVTVTDANGCSQALPASGVGITITAPQPMAVQSDNKTNVTCLGSNTGTAQITVSGGTGTKTYCWNTGVGGCVSTQEDPTNLPAGVFNVVVTDQMGCTAVLLQNVTIAAPSSALSANGNTTASPCFDQPSGAITVNATGGWAGYTYAWTGPVSVPPVSNPSPLPGGIYTVTVTDAGQCTSTASFTVGGAPAITSNPTVQNVTCFGTNNGGINLNLAGGNQPWQSIVWSNTSLTGASIGTLEPGSYQPTVTDAQGCTKVFSPVVITGPQVLVSDTTVTAANPNNGAIDWIYVSGGTGNPANWTYSWTGPGGFTAATQDISNLVVGDYTLQVTDDNGCSRTFTYNVPSGNVLLSSHVQSVKNACDHDGCIFIEIPQTAAAQTPLTINWGTGNTQTNSLSPSICDLGAGIYNVTITAANGNSVVLQAIQISQLDPASVNSNTTNPFSSTLKNGKIKLTPAPGVQCTLQYQWAAPISSTASEISNLDQGTYTVTITNPCSGCVSVETFTLEYGPLDVSAPSGAIVNPNCTNNPTGSINITVQGGNPPYTYSWVGPNGYTETTEDINTLYPGVYNVTATDVDGRTVTGSYTLTSMSDIEITNVNILSDHNGTPVSGANICDGIGAVVFTPGVGNTTIQWSNGVSGANNNSLCGGAYSVTVTDAVGCSSVWTGNIAAPAAITANSESNGVACHGDCDGTAKVIPSGGVQPYTVQWSTGQIDQAVFSNSFSQAVNLCGGDYNVTITDKNGVPKVISVNVPQPAEIVVSFSETTPRNFNACDGELLVNAAGAVAPITYVWSGSFGHTGDTERAINLCSGEFVQYYITDAHGCTAYATDSVPYPEDGCFRVSPVLTPGQQDGKNDNVHITCIETALKNHIEIYNRWGQLVFEADGYTNDDGDRDHNWNGLTKGGDALAEGVYYYVLTFTFFDDLGEQREGVHKGAINLLR